MSHSPLIPESIIELPSWEQPAAWNEPIEFESLETPEIPTRWLPGVFREFAEALTQASETPAALSVMTILGVLSTALAGQVAVSPKTGWVEPINIYTLIALPPANHKSLVVRACTQPLRCWEKEQKRQRENELKRQRAARKTEERILDALRNKAAKIEDKAEQQRLFEAIIQQEMALTDISPLPVLFTNDATPESLTHLVAEQGGRLAIFSDEGGILETLAGLYSHGSANIDILLKGIDGGEIRVHRKDRSAILNPYLTVVLTVQPVVIQNMAGKKAYLGKGVLERFLYVLPQSRLGYRTHNTPPLLPDIQAAYDQAIMALLNTSETQSMRILSLSPGAQSAWRAFQLQLETELRPEGALHSYSGWGGKLAGFTLRLAGLLHVAEYGLQRECITESTVQTALALADVLKLHAVTVFQWMNQETRCEDAQVVWQWIQSHTQGSFTQAEIRFALRNKKQGQSQRLMKALAILQERHLISAPVRLNTRKPTTVYRVNPLAAPWAAYKTG
jgi:Protein of unknown function (DUF3987)